MNPMRPLEVINKVQALDPGIKEYQVIDALSYLLQSDGMWMTDDRKYKLGARYGTECTSAAT